MAWSVPPVEIPRLIDGSKVGRFQILIFILGWSLGVGRIGSIVGPVLGGELIRGNWSNADLFLAVAIPAALSALVLLVMVLVAGKTGPMVKGAAAH
ncbi:hypothetical protein LMG23992_01001 [Cupriavidus laharis]|uniref:Major facilitator superfamily (MFS) profile domain-containing protein n=1 Tax=Cupriavidus laharis TaxID=151654 RepID=A0ABN7Y3X3_9BURK|nr:hypothetical protein LMG23992_01001 [Cupriavidus laharis]